MKQLLIIILSGILLTSHLVAQNPAPKPEPETRQTSPEVKKTPLFGISITGYVKTDLFFDSRQTTGLREGHFLLFPENKKPDADGNDINAKANYNILSIQTRLAGSITGPDGLGAKTSGYIEAEFFGNINTAINAFRLRHAWVKLKWPKAELLVGQWWHPMFVPECSPSTISFNTGAPFVVFSRNPQIKVTRSFGKVKLALTVLSQVDFVSDGPDGPNAKYLRNSVLPESDLQVQYSTTNEEKSTEFVVGAGLNYQMLTPRLSTTVTLSPASDTIINNVVFHHDAITSTYKASTKSSSLAGNVYAKLKVKKVTLKVGAEYGENNNSYTMLGGFAVKSVTNKDKGFVDYANLRSFAAWAEFHSNSPKLQPGLFMAYGKTLGATLDVAGPFYSRGNNIDYAYRISPRLVYNVNNIRFAGEVEYTVAAYGKTTGKGLVSDSKEVGNLRILLGVYYYF